MKYFLFSVCVFPFLSVSNKPAKTFSTVFPNYADTGHINHVTDGLTTEWPSSAFHISDDSTVEYAIDNDDKSLYLAMTIQDFGEQTKIMRNGMKVFIDLKGKKKEGKGVEFPIKGEAGSSTTGISPNGPNAVADDPTKKLDKKTARSIMSLSVVALKIFGMGNSEDEQGLMMPGSVNIAFKWDESDAMHIEYNIPLSLLGEPSSLNQKDVSIGWKINGFEKPEGEHHGQSEAGGEGGGGGYSRGMHGGGGGGGRGQYGAGGGRGVGMRPPTPYKKIDPEEMRKEQNLWTKYVIDIPSNKKAF